MRAPDILLPLLALLLAPPLAGDEVHLVNGRVFEDVIAEVGADSVRIHLAFGEMSLPRHTVERVVRLESSLEELQMRHDALASDPGAGAVEWIELGRWALQRGLRHGARQAALEAAARDPAAPGLTDLMRSLGYVFDAESGRWLPYEESLRRRGYDRVDGRWLSPEQQLTRARSEAAAARARRADEESRLTRAVLALAAAQLVREPEPVAVQPIYPWPFAGTVAVGPGHFQVGRPPHHAPRPHHSPRPHHDPAAIPIERRQPGSLFPIARHHHGGVARPHVGSAGAQRVNGGSGD